MRPHLPRVLTGSTLLILIAVTAMVGADAAATEAPATQAPEVRRSTVPVLAYYYIWFDPRSWDRAKSDFPALGRYSSDDIDVMRQHVRWAKAAGIDGFIVSWKDTEVLSRRLGQLVEVARQEDFKLVIIYQGLDFRRDPQPVERIAADLDTFADTYASDPIFDLFGRPLVIWSGTWKFSREQIAQVTGSRRARLLILASQRNVADYQAIADLVDGDAYYWSSVNPATYPGYVDKLKAIADAVHAQGGRWIAPAAPGFDARLVGGTRTVSREDGATLRTELAAALASSPDAVGLISWNEFSENSHVEPSCLDGTRTLRVLAAELGGTAPESVPCTEPPSTSNSAATPAETPAAGGAVAPTATAALDERDRQRLAKHDFDSSDPSGADFRLENVVLLGGLFAVVIGSGAVIARRSRKEVRPDRAV